MGKVIAEYSNHLCTETTNLQIRTVAAIIIWIAVALLLLNRALMLDWVLPLALLLTVVAIIVYFSPRFTKKEKQTTSEEQPTVTH